MGMVELAVVVAGYSVCVARVQPLAGCWGICSVDTSTQQSTSS